MNLREPRVLFRNVWHYESWSAQSALRQRIAFVDTLRAQASSDSDLDGAAMIFAELVGNVVQHAGGPVRIDVVWRNDGRARLTVSDRGPGFNYSRKNSDPYADNGRGLFIVGTIGDSLAIERTPDGSRVDVLLPVWRETALA